MLGTISVALLQKTHGRQSHPPPPPLHYRHLQSLKNQVLLSNMNCETVMNSVNSPSKGRTTMMERHSNGLEWQSSCDWRPKPNNRNRCLPSGLGRFVVPVRKTTPDQLFRVDERSLCSESLHKAQNASDNSAIDGKCPSSNIPGTSTRWGAQGPPYYQVLYIQSVELVSAAPEQYYCKAYPRLSECSSQPGI